MHGYDLAWGLVTIAFLVVYFMVLFRLVLDLFRQGDIPAWAKAAWCAALLVVPLLGMLAYVLVRGRRIAWDDRTEDRLNG